MFKLVVFLAILAVALAAPGLVGAPLAAPFTAPFAAPYAYAAHPAYSAPLAAYTAGIGYPAAYSAPLVNAAYFG
ncbi:hypothetical protein L798_11450 [Zootermopsis nevadensis]|uniref:Neuropeptide-like 4 n=1 Tax=Zootermopsis nevadensis TaxID=136037 RepID=A0A067R5Q2_ZOONE|nr:hypothetical protein L798_11450 [Zootermopsis nevadensis]